MHGAEFFEAVRTAVFFLEFFERVFVACAAHFYFFKKAERFFFFLFLWWCLFDSVEESEAALLFFVKLGIVLFFCGLFFFVVESEELFESCEFVFFLFWFLLRLFLFREWCRFSQGGC